MSSQGSARSSSLPPLRPRSREEVAAAAAVAAAPCGPPRRGVRPREAPAGGKCWTRPPVSRPPASSLWDTGPRGDATQQLFRSFEADAGAAVSATSLLRVRASSAEGKPGAGARALAGPPAAASGVRSSGNLQQPQQPQQPPKLKRGSYLQTIKAVYVGLGTEPGDPAEAQERLRVLDAALDAARGATNTTDLEVRRARQEFTKVKTGEDAIKFFTRYGGDGGAGSDVRVLYCNRAATAADGGQPGPYDLAVVPKEQAQSEYFTISISGVVHFEPGQLSECTPLAEWMQQTLMYRVLRSMTFFRLYAHRKALWQWRASARHSLYCRQRLRLARRCFLAKPLFVGPVMQLRIIAAAAGEVPILQLPDGCSSLSDFAALQKSACLDPSKGASRQVERRQDDMCSVLEQLATTVAGANGHGTKAGSRGPSPEPLKGKPMVQQKLEAQELIRRQVLLKEDEGRLGSCIRLATCILQATLVASAQGAAEQLRSRVVCDGVDGSRRLLTVQAAWAEGTKKGGRGSLGAADLGDIVLDPQLPVLREAVSTIWKDAVGCLHALPTLCGMSPKLRAVADGCRGSGGESGRVSDALSADRSFQAATSDAWNALEAQMSEAYAFAKSELLEPCRRIQTFARTWDAAAYLTQEHTFRRIEQDIEQAKRLQQDLARCRVQRVFGCLLFDARTLRERFVPIPDNALATMEKSLANLVRESCAELSHRLVTCLRRLEERPEDIAGYAAFAEAYEAAVLEQVAVEPAVEGLREAFDLLARQGFRVPLDEKVLYEDVLRRERHLADRALLEARLFLDRNKPRPSVTVTIENPFEVTARSFTLLAEAEM